MIIGVLVGRASRKSEKTKLRVSRALMRYGRSLRSTPTYMLVVEHWIRPSPPTIITLRIQGRLLGRLARMTSQLRPTPPEARI